MRIHRTLPRSALWCASCMLTSLSLSAQAAKPTPAAREDEIVELSPFSVQASGKDIGYFTENTLAGSRLNTNVGDLASSITIVTKQQLVDTASTNINDVFLYEANTEGVGNYYSPQSINRGAIKDTMYAYSNDGGQAYTPANSNRIRGLGTADTAQDNYPTIARMPWDTYNTESVEINRGPNSLLFGLGSPAGIVNQSSTTANLRKDSATAGLRFGSFGSFRGNIGINRVLLQNKLGLYVAALYDSVGYQRKPSSDITRRQYATLTWKPFSKTKLKGSFENYENTNRRPNSITPRDYVTPWVQSGRPMFDPITRMVTYKDTGRTMGPYVLSNQSPGYVAGTLATDAALTSPTSNLYVPTLAWTDYARPAMYIDQGKFTWLQRQFTTGAYVGGSTTITAIPTAAERNANPALWALYERRTTVSAVATPTNYSTWLVPGSTDKNLYDWEKYNIVSCNFGEAKNKTFNLELEQQLLPNLHAQLGWFRQEYDSVENYTMSQQQTATLMVDTNTRLTDGSPNPNAGRIYVDEIAPDTFRNPEINNNYRAMLAYEIDATKKDGWMKWLGRHRALALWSQQENTSERNRIRPSFVDGDARYLPNKTVSGWNYPTNSGSIRRIYYVGDANQRVTQDPGHFGNPGWGPDSASIKTYNWVTSQFDNAAVKIANELFWPGTVINEKEITSSTFALQSYLLKDRLVTLVGVRKDDFKARATNGAGLTAAQQYPDGHADYSLIHRMTDWEKLSGTTKTLGVVAKPLRWLSVFYNKSDNFNPPPSRQTDVFGRALPKPVGEGKDYGFAVSMLQDKLVARLNWFDTTSQFERGSNAGTALGRIQRMDTQNFRSWAEYVVRIRSGEKTTDTDFASATVRPLSQAQKDQVATLTGLPYEWPTGMSIGSTQTNSAKGLELNLIYNPMPNWNMKFTVGKQQTSYSSVAPEAEEWIASRMPFWKAAKATDMPAVAFNSTGREISLRDFWTGYGFNSDALKENTNGWNSPTTFWDSVIVPELSLVRALEGQASPNQRKWRSDLISTYLFNRGALKGFSVGGGIRWEDRMVIGYFGDTVHLNTSGQIAAADVSRPIYVGGRMHLDLWTSYTTKIMDDKVKLRIQLNVRDVLEDGRLEPIGTNYDGSFAAYRIIDPRKFALSFTFDF